MRVDKLTILVIITTVLSLLTVYTLKDYSFKKNTQQHITKLSELNKYFETMTNNLLDINTRIKELLKKNEQLSEQDINNIKNLIERLETTEKDFLKEHETVSSITKKLEEHINLNKEIDTTYKKKLKNIEEKTNTMLKTWDEKFGSIRVNGIKLCTDAGRFMQELREINKGVLNPLILLPKEQYKLNEAIWDHKKNTILTKVDEFGQDMEKRIKLFADEVKLLEPFLNEILNNDLFLDS